MKKRSFYLIGFLVFLVGCTEKELTNMGVEMFNPDGDSLGTIKLSEQAEGVKMEIVLEGIPSGEHAIHIHENPTCNGPDFKTAGNHFNPDNKQHGLMHPEGAHAGDIPNIVTDPEGKTEAELVASQVTLKKGAKNSLLFKEGTSIVITENKDDGMTQPSGDSGERIACGEITEKEAMKKEKKEVKKKEEEK
ncbi:superoxide dismutase family protein [Metabacillus arenae]|uniref:Superoxide dismutase [Cu-Zn] n=1 Tax=Metabacillus arenae TaxID=2771434 RepID=A0A926S336_9BACI|nr:superoxide dismutase family protein [Metabacillus arenae]MBD1382579.1 superoxide dismutase family protein [Metabacillus arenae]